MKKYVEDRASLSAFLMSSRVGDVSMDAARDIAADAKANMLPHSASGKTAAGYKVEPSTGGEDAEGGIRRTANVYNETPGAAANEFGYGAVPERRPLRRAADPYHVPRVIRRGSGWA